MRHIQLYAERLADGQMGYGFAKGTASVPGPLIELNEGDTAHITLENTTDVAVSLHVHGLDYEISSDGTKLSRSEVEPGGSRTYTWRTHSPGRRTDGTWRAGSAGYWHYHDHVVGTEHGTGGIRKGLYGPVIVRRKGDILPDTTYTIVFNDMTINNRPGHQGPDFEATVGDRVEFVMITHGEYYHTFHMHGHRWADNRTGLLTGPDDPSQVLDNKIVGPADSFGFQVIAGRGRRGRVDVPLPCPEPLGHGDGGAVPGEEDGRDDSWVRAARCGGLRGYCGYCGCFWRGGEQQLSHEH